MPFPKKLKIVYERNGCIGASSCAALNPVDFAMNKADGKADLAGAKTADGRFVKEITVNNEADIERIVVSANSCPVNIIEVWDMAEKKKLAPTA